MNNSGILTNYELRAHAREKLNGVWNKMAFIFFIYFLILSPYTIISLLPSVIEIAWALGITSLLETIDELTELADFYGLSILLLYGDRLLLIAVFVIAGPFAVGFASVFLKRLRNEEFSTENMFDGFRQFGRSFLLMLLTFIFVFLWTLLLLIPGIIKSFAYSLAFYILYDNPNMTPRQALRESARLMKGYKGKMFGLYLSFIGWTLLGILTLGIGCLWLYPYIEMTIAGFYENLKTVDAQKNTVVEQASNQTLEAQY